MSQCSREGAYAGVTPEKVQSPADRIPHEVGCQTTIERPNVAAFISGYIADDAE